MAELLLRRRESAKLDYKVGYNGSQGDRIELTKDLVAMANTAGGYVVLGVEDDGSLRALARGRLRRWMRPRSEDRLRAIRGGIRPPARGGSGTPPG